MPLTFARAVLVATAIAGTLDILSAFAHAGALAGISPGAVLRFVASGPFPAAATAVGSGWAAVGLAVHYALMALMAAVFLAAARSIPAIARNSILSGAAYGFGIWLVMYWVVRPLRWPGTWPRIGLTTTVPELLFHVGFVGITFGLVARRMRGRDVVAGIR